MITKISTKGQIVLPAEIREQDNLQPGQQFDIKRLDTGQYLLKRRPTRPNAGLVDLLLNCPAKGALDPELQKLNL